MIDRRLAVAALALTVAAAASAQSTKFSPPRLIKAELPPLPAPTVVGGGEVLIEGIVDRTGLLGRPIIVRGTPPYTQMVLDAIATWRFDPAKDVGPDGRENIVEMPVTVTAVYRPPSLMNAPTVGEPPRDWSRPSGEAASPIATPMPNYPPHARDGGVVLFEMTLDEAGAVTGTRSVGSTAGFESASREALANWRFKGGLYRARPVPSTAYVLFGFRPPVVGPGGGGQGPGTPCLPNDPRPQCRPPKPGAAP